MIIDKPTHLLSARAKYLKEKKRLRIDKEREAYDRKQDKERRKKEEEQKKKYLELKEELLNYISSREDISLISVEDNYMLIAKRTHISVNILKLSNPMQPYRDAQYKDLCILSLIDYGPVQRCSTMYEKLMDELKCKVYRISNKDNIHYTFKRLDDIEI